MKILVNTSGSMFPGGSDWHAPEAPLMRLQALPDYEVMTSYCHKSDLTKVRSSDKFNRFTIPSKVSPERSHKPVESFTNGHTAQKSKLASDSRIRRGSDTSTLSTSSLSSSLSSSSSLSFSRPIYSARSKTELEMRRAPSRTLDPEDYKRVGSLEDSPKWSRIKEAFEGPEAELPLSKSFSRSTSSLTKPVARQLAAVTVKRTESCDRGSRYRPKTGSLKTLDCDLESRSERMSSRISVDRPKTGSSKTLDCDLESRSERVLSKISLDKPKTRNSKTLDSDLESRSERTSSRISLEISNSGSESKMLSSGVSDSSRRRTLERGYDLSPRTRYSELDDKSKRSIILDESLSSRRSSARSFDSDSEVSSLRKTRYSDYSSVSKLYCSETTDAKLSRVRNHRSNFTDSERSVGSRKSSLVDDLRVSRRLTSKCESDSEVSCTRSTLPEMDSIKSLKSYLKELQDSKHNRHRFLKSDSVMKERLSLNISISTDRESKKYKSCLTDTTDIRPKGRPASEYPSYVDKKESYLDWEVKATQSYLKKLEETRLSRLRVKEKLCTELEASSIDKKYSQLAITAIPSEKTELAVTKADPELVSKSSRLTVTEVEKGNSEDLNHVELSPKETRRSGALARPRSAVSPIKENYLTSSKLERGLTFHGTSNGPKDNLEGWKMTSSGSWIKVKMEKEVYCSTTIKSKVALLAHQFDHLKTSGGESPTKELVLFKTKESFPEKPNLTCQSLNAICCPVFTSPRVSEESESRKKVASPEKVITCESKKIGLVKQVVQNFEESTKTSSSSESETSPSSTKNAIGTSPAKTVCSRKSDRDVVKTARNESVSPRSQRHSSSKEAKVHGQDRKEERTYCSFPGKSKMPSSQKLTIPPRFSSRTCPSPPSKNAHQRPTVPPPRKPTKSVSSSDFPKGSSLDGESSLLAELEKWLVQKYDQKEPPGRQPNESFLWKKLGPRLSSESDDSTKISEISEENVQGYYSSPFSHSTDGEDHIYMEANFVPRNPGQGSHEGAQGCIYDSDEGWVDVDDAELEQIVQEAKDTNSEVLIRSRPKNLKSHCVRRSWVQSVRDKSSNSNEWTQKDYKDITVWETEEGDASSTSSTNSDQSDHLYEALYDVIMPEEEITQDVNTDTASSHDLASVSQDTGINEASASCGNLADTNDFASDKTPGPDSKDQGLKRNWSLTKSDIRLELTSNLNKVKVRKDIHSTTDVSEPVSDTEVVTSKKKTLIKFILRQKNNTAKKRTHKKGATFYVRWSKVDRETRECNGQDEQDGCEPTSPAGTSEVDGKRVATVKRRPSNPVRRPTTPPPLPPIAGGQVRSHEGTKSLEIIRSLSASSMSTRDKAKSLDSAQILKLEHGGDALQRNDSFARSSYSSSQGSCSPSSSSQSSHEIPNGNALFLMPKSRGSVASSLSSHSGNSYIPEDEVASIPKPNSLPLPTTEEEVCYLQLRKDISEPLRSPFEEEPLYQFYNKGVKQRATKLQMLMAMDEEEHVPRNQGTEQSDVNLSPVSVSSTSSGIPSAMELLIHDIGNQRTLWCEVPEVRNSGILDQVTMQERKLQEAMFEVITSEASYLKSLNVLIEHFMECPEFSDDFSVNCVLGRRERHVLFSDVIPVREVSIRLLSDLEQRWQENILISNICDIMYEHASKFFSVYVKYCANQVYQDRILKEMKATRPDFISVLQRLESNPICQGLDMLSFLMLPMQRITRMPLLVDAIFHRLTTDSPYYDICKLTLATLNKVVAECNEAARKMERMEEMLVISRQLDFKDCKSIPLISASRWLVKKGELVRLVCENAGRNKTFGRSTRYTKFQLYLFLFTDLLLIAKKKSDDAYIVQDYCPRNLVQVFTLEDAGVPMLGKLPESHKNVFQLTMLQNHEFKTVELILGCPLESDRTRWMEAVTPPVAENPEERIYEEWDCPQVQCVYPYYAKQPDELTLEESDVVNVFRKMPDGWYEGERLRDGVKGWFPAAFTVEIISSHIRARNLRQRYRLLMLSQAYVEEQRRAFLLDKSDKSK